MSSIFSFNTDPIRAFAFNKDKTLVAICQNSPEVSIYRKKSDTWVLDATLKEHDLPVTDLDWAPETNKIVTCSEDRNAYVWSYTDGTWVPSLVHIRSNRAATCVKWSPKEDKFVVGTGSRKLCVCFYCQDNDWWVSKHIKKPFTSTIKCLSWHPNNLFVACGSSDFTTHIVSTYLREADGKVTPEQQSSLWAKDFGFGTILASFNNPGGWIHGVSFSPNGSKLAWVSHSSEVFVAEAGSPPKIHSLKSQTLPFLHCLWLSEDKIVVAGYDNIPMLVVFNQNSGLQFEGKIEAPKKKNANEFSARQMFKNLDLRAETQRSSPQESNVHKNTISKVLFHSNNMFATSGYDGTLALWDMKALEINKLNGK